MLEDDISVFLASNLPVGGVDAVITPFSKLCEGAVRSLYVCAGCLCALIRMLSLCLL